MSIHDLFKTPILRAYQILGIGKCRVKFKTGVKIILNLATGGGKTFMASEITRLARNKGTKVVILCHRYEIMIQFYESLLKFGVDPNFLYKDQKVVGQVNLSMVETYHKRYPDGVEEDILIIDECHIGNFHKVLKKTKATVLGLTATPISSKVGYNMHEHFDEIVTVISTPDLIESGNLVRGRTYSVEHDWSNVKMRGGDFDTDEMVAEFRKTPKLMGGALENYLKHCKGKKYLCFSASVDQSKEQCDLFNAAGIKSEHVDGGTPDAERERIFRELRDGDLIGVHNVGIATAGFDCPAIECIIENFATVSLAKHFQVTGRGSRPHPGKEFFTIIDLGKNYSRHGLYGDDIDWVKIFNNPRKDKNRKEDAKKLPCPKCGAILTVPRVEDDDFGAVDCPYCSGGITEKEVKDAQLDVMTAKEVEAFQKKERIENLPDHLKGLPLSQMTNEQLKEYGVHLGYSPKWAQIRALKRKYR